MNADSSLPVLSPREKSALVEIARRTLEDPTIVRRSAGEWEEAGIALAPLHQVVPRGVFVTLRSPDGSLRGCIGTLRAADPLFRCIARFAVAAGYEDPRFPPVEREELDALRIHLSILAPDRLLDDPSELRLGIDGVVLDHPGGSAVFLPEVAVETGWDVPTLLTHLSRKAGLGTEAWKEPRARIFAFETVAFGEEDLPGA